MEEYNFNRLRHKGQEIIKNYIDVSKRTIIPIVVSRRYGTTYEIVLNSIEYGMNNPGSNVSIIVPRTRMIKGIYKPLIFDTFKELSNLGLEWKENDKNIILPNGSRILLVGNNDYENLIGIKLHRIYIDNAGFHDHLQYLIGSILRPSILTTNGQIVIMSNLPFAKDNDFNKIIENNSFLNLTMNENPLLKKDQISELHEMYEFGKEDSEYKREYLNLVD